MRSDWLPRRRSDQLAMAKNWNNVLAESGAGWGVTTAEMNTLLAKTADADDTLIRASGSERTESLTALLNMRFKALTDHMRYIKERRFLKPPLTDVDLIDLGLKPKDTIKSKVPVPTDTARGSIELTIRYVLVVLSEIIVGPHSDERANHGVRIYYSVVTEDPAAQSALTGRHYYLSAPPHSPEQLIDDDFTRRKRHIIAFPTEDSGKTAWFALRVENAKGGKGPWSEMFSAVIP